MMIDKPQEKERPEDRRVTYEPVLPEADPSLYGDALSAFGEAERRKQLMTTKHERHTEK